MNASKGLNCPLADGKCIYILCAKVPFFFLHKQTERNSHELQTAKLKVIIETFCLPVAETPCILHKVVGTVSLPAEIKLAALA